MSEGKDIVPIHAQGFFCVHRRGLVNQIIIYDYYDPKGYYAKLIHRPLDYENEMKKLAANMQYFLDQEQVLINGEKVRPIVKSVSLDHRGFMEIAYITYVIEFKGRFKRGVNTYENIYEVEVAEYDYEVYWIFPPRTKIIEVEVAAEYEILGDGNILLFWVRKGDKLKGYEKIAFKLP